MRQRFPQTHEEKLAYLRELREQAIHSTPEEAFRKQHAKGDRSDRLRLTSAGNPGLNVRTLAVLPAGYRARGEVDKDGDDTLTVQVVCYPAI